MGLLAAPQDSLHPLAGQWREWLLLGFLPNPTLSLVRPTDVVDSRALRGMDGQRVRVVGLLALDREWHGGRHELVVEDEWGLMTRAAATWPA